MAIDKVTVSWKISWPGVKDFNILTPEVTVERTVEQDETYDEAFRDAHNIALQSTIECIQDGLEKLEKYK